MGGLLLGRMQQGTIIRFISMQDAARQFNELNPTQCKPIPSDPIQNAGGQRQAVAIERGMCMASWPSSAEVENCAGLQEG